MAELVLSERTVISVGYEGRSVDEVISLLVAQRVDVLVDVRLNAISRKAGLSKTKLRERLQASGIEYLHLRDLGNPKDNRTEFRSGSRAGRVRYEREMDSPAGRKAMAELREVATTSTVGILCFEADHSECHRSSVIEQLLSGLTGGETVRL